jgi:hypothetical protein
VIHQASRIADVHPLSDPWGSGLLSGESGALMHRSPPRPGGMIGGDIGDHEGPLEGIGSSVGEVLAGNGTGSDERTDRESGPGGEPSQPSSPRQPIESDADPWTRGIFDLGDNRLTHIRPMHGPTGADAPGPGFAATDLGKA